jgi:uncharacterized RDD family membrane protein YckC
MYCSHCGAQNPDDARFCSCCGKPILQGSGTPLPTTAVKTVEYAGFWRRFVAHIVDRLILGIPTAIVVLASVIPSIAAVCKTCSGENCSPHDILSTILTIVFGWIWLVFLILVLHLLYFVWFESSKYQATPGKMLLGIIVTDLNGQRISFVRSLGRNLGKIISHLIFNIGFIMAGVTLRKQALHDMLADCLVVVKPDNVSTVRSDPAYPGAETIVI